ncbi:hypothetical protein C9374_011642 [Naegleria lovaniensis]|uniref:LNS2/PITP domain-containing protein n=1 Tax=Naegleria lovaniensis TaxID=51637 RepID=A0AA88GE79_NAELO|nr:uncharacterized protein C9374_011642 [Naegleria lovaniensis]KAG2373977.1 hypothetical protein C9374_011642 [Naegleria lovaniensis]
MACVDIIIVKQEDGSYQSSPFFVRFPQRTKFRRVITVKVNGKKIECPNCELIVDPDHNYAYFSIIVENNQSETSSPQVSSPVIVGENKTFANIVPTEEAQIALAQYRKKSLPPLPTSMKKTVDAKPPSELVFEKSNSNHSSPTNNTENMSQLNLNNTSGNIAMPNQNNNGEERQNTPTGSPPKLLPPLPKKTIPQNLIIKNNLGPRDTLNSPEENEELRREEREMMLNDLENHEDPDDEEKEMFKLFEEETTVSSRSRSKAVTARPRAGSGAKNLSRSPKLQITSSDDSATYYTSSSPTGSPSKTGYMDKWLKSIDSETHPEHRLRPSKEFLDIIHSHMTDFRSTITFTDTSGLNPEPIKGYIFEFSPHDKIIVSDVDGTITKSDLMGQVYSRMGKDYTHPGIAKLFQSIAENNYKFIYLSARPITMAQLTREYIQTIYQDGYKMPLGPTITSPNKAFNALAREVIIRRPETFKINCLTTIASLFPTDFPFYSGFGNRPTDCISYVSVNIDPTKCYRVNKQGKLLVQATKVTFASYNEIESQIMKHFPKTVNKHQRSQSDASHYKLNNGQLVTINLPKKKDLEVLREQYLNPEELQI